MNYCLLITLLAALCCSACAPRQEETMAHQADVAVAPPTPDAALARFIGTGFDGDRAVFDNTLLGSSVTVKVGTSYLSALGRPCKRAYCLEGGRSVTACQDENGVWTLAPDIFENGAF